MSGRSMKLGIGVLLVALLSLSLKCVTSTNSTQHQHAHYARLRVCDQRGGAYCSSGLTKGYVGPLDSAQNIKDALAATAYKQELIIFAETRLGEASQTLARFRNAGYSHIMAIMPEPHDCQHMAQVFAPWLQEHGPVSCGTYATHDPSGRRYPADFQYMARGIGFTPWWRKWFTTARAVALGYNILAVDSDSLVLADPYWRLKAPDSPLAELNLITQSESQDCINSGFTYVQDAAPDGPIAWMMMDMTQKVVRWGEDPSLLFQLSPRANQTHYIWSDDQESMTDVLYSAMMGKPRFYVLGINLREEPEALAKLGAKDWGDYVSHIKPPADFWRFKSYPVSGSLAAVVCDHLPDVAACQQKPATAIHIRTAVLQMPHSGGEWPIELGGNTFSNKLGPLTLAYRQSFKDLGVPLPPDPEDPASEAAARATKKELFGLVHVRTSNEYGRHVAGWLQSTWYNTGQFGLWHLHLKPPEYQSLAHIHAGLFPGDFQKQVIMQATGFFDWRVAARVAGSPDRVYLAHDDSEGVEQPDIRRIVAYAPGVVGPELTKEQFLLAAQGLAQVSVALGAVAAWPAVPCTSAWVQGRRHATQAARNVSDAAGPARHVLPWFHLNTEYQVVPFGESLEALQCQWVGFTWRDCLTGVRPGRKEGGRGMLALEFAHHLRHTKRQLHAAHRGALPIGTTLQLDKGGSSAAAPLATTLAGGTVDSSAPAAPAAQLHNVTYDDLLALNSETLLQSRSAEATPVLWLDRLVGSVGGMRGAAAELYDNWRQTCRALKYYDIPERDRDNW